MDRYEFYDDLIENEQSLQHHGVLGMHWGVRRYQNKDGSLTRAGRKRYEAYNNTHKALKNHSKYATRDANSMESRLKKAAKPTEKQLSKILRDDFGSDANNSRYIKSLTEMSPKEYATSKYYESIGTKEDVRKLRDYAAKTSSLADRYSNPDVSNISSRDYRSAKKFAKKNYYSMDAVTNPNQYNDQISRYLKTPKSGKVRTQYPEVNRYMNNPQLKSYAKEYDMVYVRDKKTKSEYWTPRNPKLQRTKKNMNSYDILFDSRDVK